MLFIIVALLALLLPGLAWLVWWGARKERLDPASALADATGISLAIAALIGLGTFYLGGLAAWVVVSGYVLAAVLVLIGVWRLGVAGSESCIHRSPFTIHYAPFLLFAALIAFRFYQSRTLVLPAWVDSLHHTLIVRLILERGGVPQTLEPYIPATFYYHFGFHLNTALFAFFARLSPERAVLVFGQVLNAVVGLAVYRLGMALWGDWRRSSVALLLVGFVLQMPAYYVTWGRYTLLAGMVLLALAMAAGVEITRRGANCERVARLAVLTAGLLLTHYFAATLLALFFGVLWIERWLFGEGGLRRGWADGGMRALLTGGGAGALLVLPWLWHVWQNASAFAAVVTVAPGQSLDEAYYPGYLSYLWYLLGPRRSHVLLIVALISLFLIGWREKTRPFALWAAAFGILSLPWGVRIAPFRPDHGAIVAFLPVALLAADAFLTPLEGETRPWPARLARGVMWAALLGLLVWGVKETREILNPVTVLATDADLQAIEWVRRNTPEEAVFFTNTAFWQGSTYRGVDGGWWITPLTGRRTLLPPALYITARPREYVLRINDWAARARELQGCDEALWSLIREAEIDYLYLVSGKGALQADALEGCEGLQLVYTRGGVSILKVATPSEAPE